MSAKVFIVDRPHKADYKVHFVDREYQEKNHQLIEGGELVQKDYKADTKVFIVDRKHQADILITRENFPK